MVSPLLQCNMQCGRGLSFTGAAGHPFVAVLGQSLVGLRRQLLQHAGHHTAFMLLTLFVVNHVVVPKITISCQEVKATENKPTVVNI